MGELTISDLKINHIDPWSSMNLMPLFGGKGDGITDDSIAFSAMCNALGFFRPQPDPPKSLIGRCGGKARLRRAKRKTAKNNQ